MRKETPFLTTGGEGRKMPGALSLLIGRWRCLLESLLPLGVPVEAPPGGAPPPYPYYGTHSTCCVAFQADLASLVWRSGQREIVGSVVSLWPRWRDGDDDNGQRHFSALESHRQQNAVFYMEWVPSGRFKDGGGEGDDSRVPYVKRGPHSHQESWPPGGCPPMPLYVSRARYAGYGVSNSQPKFRFRTRHVL